MGDVPFPGNFTPRYVRLDVLRPCCSVRRDVSPMVPTTQIRMVLLHTFPLCPVHGPLTSALSQYDLLRCSRPCSLHARQGVVFLFVTTTDPDCPSHTTRSRIRPDGHCDRQEMYFRTWPMGPNQRPCRVVAGMAPHDCRLRSRAFYDDT